MSLTDFLGGDNVEYEESDKKDIGMIRDYPISKVAKNEWRAFALYTVESRAIPSMMDGMKPVQRFYLYSSLMNSAKAFEKVAAVAGVVSRYGYNHGETSAASAGQLMAATWNNNICLVEGRGSFGTRLVQSPASPRYTNTKVSSNFGRYIMDLDLAPAHADPEHEPPAFYVPIIPILLANGTKGIATGFATNILPRCPEALVRACTEYLKTGRISERIPFKFPDFSGHAELSEKDGKVYVTGKFERKSKTVVLITEVPYGYDRETYVGVLDALEDSGAIVGYTDLCDKTGFKFEVKLKQTSATWKDSDILKEFKLVKTYTENITVIDYDGKLREYKDERELIKDFCDYRIQILGQRIALRIKEFSEDIRWLNVKMQFIRAVLDDKIVFKSKTKKDVISQILKETDANSEDGERLLRINIMSLTSEMVDALYKEQKEAEKNLTLWTSTTEKKQFMSDLEKLKS
jgi:DNA gyrase/topoisomerase IV subunit A